MNMHQMSGNSTLFPPKAPVPYRGEKRAITAPTAGNLSLSVAIVYLEIECVSSVEGMSSTAAAAEALSSFFVGAHKAHRDVPSFSFSFAFFVA